jgi:hypothetical protein
MQLPLPSLASLVGSYGDPADKTSAAPVTVSADGSITARITSTCSVAGTLSLAAGDPAYRVTLLARGTCPAGFIPGSGIVIFDKKNNQIYLVSMYNSASATLVSAVKR